MRNGSFASRGLSLLETLLTITIITVAVSVVLPVSKIYIVAQREETLKKNLADVREAIDKFRKEKSRYPNSIDELLENRYLRRMETEPFGGRWQYKPHTGEHEWKDFDVSVLTDKPYLASVKNMSMKAKKTKIKRSAALDAATVETGLKSRPSSGETGEASAVVESGEKVKDGDGDKTRDPGEGKNKDDDSDGKKSEYPVAEGGTGSDEIEIDDEIYDIRTATEYTGINGVPYNQW